jgi:hypothetical protein
MIGDIPVTADQIQASIGKLEAALARGETRVQFADRLVEYRSVSDLTNALAYFKSQLREVSGTGRQSYGVAVKGF